MKTPPNHGVDCIHDAIPPMAAVGGSLVADHRRLAPVADLSVKAVSLSQHTY